MQFVPNDNRLIIAHDKPAIIASDSSPVHQAPRAYRHTDIHHTFHPYGSLPSIRYRKTEFGVLSVRHYPGIPESPKMPVLSALYAYTEDGQEAVNGSRVKATVIFVDCVVSRDAFREDRVPIQSNHMDVHHGFAIVKD